MMDLRLDKNSPSLRPLNASLTSLSRRVSMEKDEMEDYEKWLTSLAAAATTTTTAVTPLGATEVTDPSEETEMEKRRLKEKRRESETAVAAAPVSYLLGSLKRDVEAAKLRDKMFEIDLMNMVASDDII